MRRVLWLLPLFLAGCGNLSYYAQSVTGHLDLMVRRRPIPQVIADPRTPPRLRGRLEAAQAIRAFASRELALPDNGSYRSYSDVQRPYVVWNVFAAPELSVSLTTWCFPVAGCVGYRGYFRREAADAFAAELRAAGQDVFVAGVPAYSTLGWFEDPLLNTFINGADTELARLIFHELAHQVAYAKDDTEFNESYASAVEQAGVERWLAAHGDAQARAGWETAQARRRDFLALMMDFRGRLEAAYRDAPDDDARRAAKARVTGDLKAAYAAQKVKWGGYAGYDAWFGDAPNNAQLASVGVYTTLVPAFRALLERGGGDFAAFHREVRALAALPAEERRRRLAAPGQAQDQL